MPDIEFSTPKPPDENENHRRLQMQRIEKALSFLAEHFHGVVILAYEQEPGGMVNRYSRMTGNDLANRYNAILWAKHEEMIESQRIMQFYMSKQKPPEDENPFK